MCMEFVGFAVVGNDELFALLRMPHGAMVTATNHRADTTVKQALRRRSQSQKGCNFQMLLLSFEKPPRTCREGLAVFPAGPSTVKRWRSTGHQHRLYREAQCAHARYETNILFRLRGL